MNKIFYRIKEYKNLEYILISIILLLGFIVRLYKINNPIADWHSWRQADTASVSRTYVERGVDLLYPRYHDISTTQTRFFNPEGYRYVEFPLLNAFHAVIAGTFPFFSLELWARLTSVIASVISIYLIYLIGKSLIGIKVGILSSFFYAFLPFNIYFTRVILPEPTATMFALLSLWFFISYTRKD
ncbi:MAG: ArnT family glycosyltransferase, partial [Patescibacteria group bacterium]